MFIQLDKLIVIQNDLRNYLQVEKMIQFVKAGGRFTNDALLSWKVFTSGKRVPPLMHISLMEDGRMVLHDGHHRAISILLGGRDYIDAELEAEVVNYTYDDYRFAAPHRGWLTPFDIDYEVRVPDFALFKRGARRAFDSGEIAAIDYINSHRDDYCEPRRIWTVQELSEVYLCAMKTMTKCVSFAVNR